VKATKLAVLVTVALFGLSLNSCKGCDDKISRADSKKEVEKAKNEVAKDKQGEIDAIVRDKDDKDALVAKVEALTKEKDAKVAELDALSKKNGEILGKKQKGLEAARSRFTDADNQWQIDKEVADKEKVQRQLRVLEAELKKEKERIEGLRGENEKLKQALDKEKAALEEQKRAADNVYLTARQLAENQRDQHNKLKRKIADMEAELESLKGRV
jgi:chromosome segregation ATPase